jgi:hypothetical protein
MSYVVRIVQIAILSGGFRQQTIELEPSFHRLNCNSLVRINRDDSIDFFITTR